MNRLAAAVALSLPLLAGVAFGKQLYGPAGAMVTTIIPADSVTEIVAAYDARKRTLIEWLRQTQPEAHGKLSRGAQ